MNHPEIHRLKDFLLAADLSACRSLLVDQAGLQGWHKTLNGILEPALEELGRLWETGEGMSLAQGYVAGKVTEEFLQEVLSHEPPEAGSNQGTAIIGNILDDFHALGRRMVGTFLQSAGWKVVDLGNDVEPSVFVEAALAHGARVVGASAMMQTTAKNIALLRKEIDSRGLQNKIMLAAGGAIFRLRPEMVAEVGADGTAGNALEAPKLFQELQARSLEVYP